MSGWRDILTKTLTKKIEVNSTNVTESNERPNERTNERKGENYIPLGITSIYGHFYYLFHIALSFIHADLC